jgi:hypothetical protein
LKHLRKLTAPLSAVLLILVAGFAFTNLQARTEYPPPILDPEFGLWVSDPNFGSPRPLVWELEYEKSVGDQISLQETVVAGRKALEIQILQDGVDGNLTYVRFGQTIDGTRLRALLDENVGIWVLLQSSCACNRLVSDQTGTFGIETNDGVHTLDFLFVETTAEMSVSPTHRTIFLQSSTVDWTRHSIDLVKQYENAGWKLPDRISMSIVFGVAGSATGWHTGYVHGFSVAKKTAPPNATQQQKLVFGFLPEASLGILPAIDQCCTPSPDTCLAGRRSSCASNVRLSQGFNL